MAVIEIRPIVDRSWICSRRFQARFTIHSEDRIDNGVMLGCCQPILCSNWQRGDPMEETEDQFEKRLCKVIAQADTRFFEPDCVWQPMAAGTAPSDSALASVTDGTQWSEFIPARPADTEGRFRVVCFRFSEDGPSAIGFVAWLHSHLRRMGKTGAIVICGKDSRNSARLFEICQGVMDYWACPSGPAGDRFIKVIRTLIDRGKS